MTKTGVLLLNLGTPEAPDTKSVRAYLREFLSDPYVLDIPAPLRWLLLNTVILPFRSKSSSALYQTIWTDEGSPLLTNSLALEKAVSEATSDDTVVALGMRYGKPSIAAAVDYVLGEGCQRLKILPLFPQYALATNYSALSLALSLVKKSGFQGPCDVVEDFFEHPDFITALADVARQPLLDFEPDHVVMSYHGLPERHITKAGCSTDFCSRTAPCPPVEGNNRRCYRAQAYATSRALADALDLEHYTVSFQSRLGRIPWIQPYTEELLPKLAEQGVKKLAVMCPSFVADCLETLEEINVRGREQWQALGGSDFQFIPCLNAHPRWVRAVVSILEL